MTTRTAEPSAPALPIPRARQRQGRSLVAAVSAAARGASEAGRLVVAALDGLPIGLVLGYVVATLVSGPSAHLGVPWPLEMLVAGLGAAAVALIGAGAGVALRGVLRLVGSALDEALARILGTRSLAGRLRRVARVPFRLVAALPAARLGALAGVLLLANVGSAGGPLGLFLPAGAFGPYVVLAGIVAAFASAAVHLARWDRGDPAQAPSPASRPRGGRLPLWRRAGVVLLTAAALFTGGGGATVMLGSGSPARFMPPDPALNGLGVATQLEDPGAPGPYAVRAISYGSGTDRRPAFGAEVTARTPTVDASRALEPLGWGADEARRWFWGFGAEALPLNGLVWLPDGPGPFPLVLVVHGNHAMGDFSEPGYTYLGEHLASRGFLTVSVDEDFLNGSWAGDWGGREQAVRAWLLLLHLDQWRTWTGDPSSPFHGLADLGRVALMGHSRGGEAASVAASLAEADGPPRPGLEPWPRGLAVRSVVAIAPSDGQYGGNVLLRGIDYLTLHGGHDSDATGWMGLRQYARTTIEDGSFRAALWSYRSNHGQFNTTWGRSDHGPNGGALLNLAPLLDAEEQQDVAKTAIGAFLEASLHGRTGYRDLFRRPMVGREWLPPDDIYAVRSSDDRFVPLTTGNPRQGRDGTTVTSLGFDSTRSRAVPLRSLLPDQHTLAVEATWSQGAGPATFEVAGLAGLAGRSEPGRPTALALSLADGSPTAAEGASLDIQVELETSDGVRVALPLSRWGALPPPLPVTLVKDQLLASISSMDLALGAPPERVLQAYVLPLADYAAADPAFDADRLASVRLLVDRASPGALWITEIGLIAGP